MTDTEYKGICEYMAQEFISPVYDINREVFSCLTGKVFNNFVRFMSDVKKENNGKLTKYDINAILQYTIDKIINPIFDINFDVWLELSGKLFNNFVRFLYNMVGE